MAALPPQTDTMHSIGRQSKADVRGATSSRGPVLGFDLDPDRTQEVIRQDTARAHDHRIVAHHEFAPGLLQQYLVTSDLAYLGIEKHLELAFGTRFVDPLTIALLGALKGFAPVRQRDRRVAQFGNAGRRFERAVTAADHHDLLTPVLFRIDQAIYHFRQIFSGHAE